MNGKQAVNGPAFSVWVSAQQTLSAGIFVKAQFKSKEFDTANCFDATTNYRFKPTVAGYYQVSSSLRRTGTGSGEWFVVLYKNGVTYKSGNDAVLSGGSNLQSHVSALVYLNGSTDYLEVYIYSDVVSTLNASQSGSYFQGVMVRGA